MNLTQNIVIPWKEEFIYIYVCLHHEKFQFRTFKKNNIKINHECKMITWQKNAILSLSYSVIKENVQHLNNSYFFKMASVVRAVSAYGMWFPSCISPVFMAVVVTVSHVSFVIAQNVTPSSSQNLISIHKMLWTIPVWTVTFKQWIFCLFYLLFWFNCWSEKKPMCDKELLHLTMRTIIQPNLLFIFSYLW